MTEDGKIFRFPDAAKEYIKYNNADGYPVVSLPGIRGYRSVAVHILVAKAFIPNPENKPEVNHKDFDRTNYSVSNLEWVSHAENVKYSSKAGRYRRLYGKDNPNYGNDALHKRYLSDKFFAQEKQARRGGINGRAKKCVLFYGDQEVLEFQFQRGAICYLKQNSVIPETINSEWAIKKLRHPSGYNGYSLKIINN